MEASIFVADTLLFQGKITSLEATAYDGELQILDQHAPMIAQLSAGQLRYTPNQGDPLSLQIQHGILHVQANNQLIVLLTPPD